MAKIDLSNINLERKLPFKLDPATGYISKAVLESITLDKQEVKEVNSNGIVSNSEFVGKVIPVLTLVFKQIPTEKSEVGRERFYTHVIKPISSVTLEDRVLTNMYIEQMRLLHNLANVYIKEKGFLFDKVKPQLIDTSTVDTHLETVYALYKYYISALNTIDYSKVILWIKLVANYSTGTYYTLPTFVGEGVFDRYVEGIKTFLEIKPNESVKLISRDNNNNSNGTSQSSPTHSDAELNEILNRMK
jgi:hypothetical protein